MVTMVGSEKRSINLLPTERKPVSIPDRASFASEKKHCDDASAGFEPRIEDVFSKRPCVMVWCVGLAVSAR